MMEMKITVEAPDLAASILKLAEAIASGPDPALLIRFAPSIQVKRPYSRHVCIPPTVLFIMWGLPSHWAPNRPASCSYMPGSLPLAAPP